MSSSPLMWDVERRGSSSGLIARRPESPRDQMERVFLDITGVAPDSCSRDFYRLQVTKRKVKLTRWIVSHGPRTSPFQVDCVLEEFPKDACMTSEVLRVFGEDNLNYVVGLATGTCDWIFGLPDSALVKIVAYVGIRNLSTVAPVCYRFQQICESDSLWKIFYFQYSGAEESQKSLLTQAMHFSWQNLFLANRVQDMVFLEGRYQLGAHRSSQQSKEELKTIRVLDVSKLPATSQMLKRWKPVPNLRVNENVPEELSHLPGWLRYSAIKRFNQEKKIDNYLQLIDGVSSLSLADARNSSASGDGPFPQTPPRVRGRFAGAVDDDSKQFPKSI